MSRPTFIATLAAAVLAVVALAFLGLSKEPPSDEEAIRALFDEAARAAGEKRVSDAVAAVSERFRGGGLDRRGVKQLVAAHVLRGEWVSIAIAGARIAIDGDGARAAVDAVLVRGSGRGKAIAALLPGEASAHRFLCRLEREEAGWRVVEAEWRAVDLADALAGPPDPGRTVR